MKHLITIDPVTGARENHGTIAKQRKVGDADLWLTYDEDHRMWWIVIKDDRLRAIGYIEARREVCWEAFFEMDEHDLVKLQSS